MCQEKSLQNYFRVESFVGHSGGQQACDRPDQGGIVRGERVQLEQHVKTQPSSGCPHSPPQALPALSEEPE